MTEVALSSKQKPLLRAIKAAQKRLPFKSDTAIERMASCAGITIAEAYRCGAEKAQAEIIKRLQALAIDALGPAPGPKEPPRPTMKEVG